jgi:hypothetical protein
MNAAVETSPSRPFWTSLAFWAPGLILTLAALLRVSAVGGELWYDEVWSWEFARQAQTPGEIFWGAHYHHDNNHKLNTLVLYVLPDGLPWWCYRVHSLVAGIVAVGLAMWLGKQQGQVEMILTGLLVGTSYWMVLYGVEARGYALALCFAFLAFGSLRLYLLEGKKSVLPLFWASVILGFLSHLTFLFCYVALLIWSVYHGARHRTSSREEFLHAVRCHAIPGLFCVLLYLVDLRKTELGGGSALSVTQVLGRLLGLGVGAGPLPWLLISMLALAVALAGLVLLYREGSTAWVFFAVVILAQPIVFLIKRPPFVFERYFLLSFTFWLILAGHLLAWVWLRSRVDKVVVVAVVALVCLGNTAEVLRFREQGRGQFLDALAVIERRTAGNEVILTADHDYHIEKMVEFYAPYLHSAKAISYQKRDSLPEAGVEWLIVHRLDHRYPPGPTARDARGNLYHLVRGFPCNNHAGWHWFVYRNAQGYAEHAHVMR